MLKEFSYIKLANNLHDGIEKGIYPFHTKLPSVRTLSKNNNISVSTVLQAFYELEKRGLIYAKEKSGYFVNNIHYKEKFALNEVEKYKSEVVKIDKINLINSIFHNLSDKKLFPISSSLLSKSLTNSDDIAKITKSIFNENPEDLNQYYMPPGLEELRNEISKKYLSCNVNVSPDEIVITSGCMEAVSFSLRSIAKAGDIIAIESPTYYGFLQLIESLGMYALEVNTDPNTGINIEEMKILTKEHKIKAFIIVSNFNNPLGSLMPDENKKEFVDICQTNKIKIIESDIYADLHFQDDYQPKPLKYYDKNDNVFLCSSLSKTVSAGLRIGWVINKKYLSELEKLKFVNSIATPSLNQRIAAKYLKNNYNRNLKLLRKILSIKISELTKMISDNFDFSEQIKLSSPKGGFLLWLKLPEKIDSFDIYKKALEKNISIIPGTVFSASSERFKNYIRFSACFDERDEMENKIKILSNIIKDELA